MHMRPEISSSIDIAGANSNCYSYGEVMFWVLGANLLLLADDGTWCKCYLWLMPFLNGIKQKKQTSMKHDFEEICLHKKITLRLFSSLLFPSSFFNILCLLSLSSPPLEDRMALHTSQTLTKNNDTWELFSLPSIKNL